MSRRTNSKTSSSEPTQLRSEQPEVVDTELIPVDSEPTPNTTPSESTTDVLTPHDAVLASLKRIDDLILIVEEQNRLREQNQLILEKLPKSLSAEQEYAESKTHRVLVKVKGLTTDLAAIAVSPLLAPLKKFIP